MSARCKVKCPHVCQRLLTSANVSYHQNILTMRKEQFYTKTLHCASPWRPFLERVLNQCAVCGTLKELVMTDSATWGASGEPGGQALVKQGRPGMILCSGKILMWY